MQQATHKRELLVQACEELASAEARVSVEHEELGKVARETPEPPDQDLPLLSPLSPLLDWHKWGQRDPTYANEYAQWIQEGSCGPEPQPSDAVEVGGTRVGASGADEEEAGEAMPAQHGKRSSWHRDAPVRSSLADATYSQSQGAKTHVRKHNGQRAIGQD